jgi:sugar phosphate isomerase/epimerase
MLIDTTAGYLELAAAVDHPRFGLTLDIGHLWCMNEPIQATIHDNVARLRNIHLEDSRRGVHEHLMFGEGEINFDVVLGDLKESGYRGGVHVELSRHSHDAVETARKAIDSLRRHTQN